jgi:hypothetical protein
MCVGKPQDGQQGQQAIPPDAVNAAMSQGVPPQALQKLAGVSGKQLPSGQQTVQKPKQKGK